MNSAWLSSSSVTSTRVDPAGRRRSPPAPRRSPGCPAASSAYCCQRSVSISSAAARNRRMATSPLRRAVVGGRGSPGRPRPAAPRGPGRRAPSGRGSGGARRRGRRRSRAESNQARRFSQGSGRRRGPCASVPRPPGRQRARSVARQVRAAREARRKPLATVNAARWRLACGNSGLRAPYSARG